MRETVLEGEIQRQSPVRELRPNGGTTLAGRPNSRIESGQAMDGKEVRFAEMSSNLDGGEPSVQNVEVRGKLRIVPVEALLGFSSTPGVSSWLGKSSDVPFLLFR